LKKLLKGISLLLCLVLIAGVFSACGSKNESSDQQQSTSGTNESASQGTKENTGKELLEYTVLTVFEETPSLGYDNPNDVVTPVVEEKFKIKVKDVMFSGGMTTMERINMLVAAGNLPDVVIIDNQNIAAAYDTGAFADLTPYKDLMKNTDIYVTDTGWNRLTVDGKLIAIPQNMSGGEIDVDNPQIADIVENDVYYRRPQNWALVANEDILAKAGYKFKTIKEIQAELDENPRPITYEDVKIEPEIKTVEDLENLLYKIKSLNLTIDGKPVIPLSVPDWGAYHVSALYATNTAFYCNPDTMEVTGFLFNPGMKEFYKTWKKWYDEGLVDRDYVIHKSEQFQEKAASGRIALMLPGFDVNAVRQSLQEKGTDLRVIPWPESTANNSIDASYPCGFNNIMINKNFKDIPRLLEYFDWFQSEEAMDLLSWGPESAGLWEIKDGKKVLKDQELMEAIRDAKKTNDGRDAEYYGISDWDGKCWSKAALCAPQILYNLKAIKRSYPPKFDAYTDTFIFVSTEKLNRDGTMLPAVGTKSGEVNTYYWNTIKTTKIAQLLSAKSDAEFDKVWDEILADYKANGSYDEGIAEMLPAFKQSLGK